MVRYVVAYGYLKEVPQLQRSRNGDLDYCSKALFILPCSCYAGWRRLGMEKHVFHAGRREYIHVQVCIVEDHRTVSQIP